MPPKLCFLPKRNLYFYSALGECRPGQISRTSSVKQQLPAGHQGSDWSRYCYLPKSGCDSAPSYCVERNSRIKTGRGMKQGDYLLVLLIILTLDN